MLSLEKKNWCIIAILRNWKNSTKMQVSAVPSNWLSACKTSLDTLRKDASSIPQPEWKNYKCILKRDKIRTYDEALLWELEYVNADTEAEENLSIPSIQPKNQHQGAVAKTCDSFGYNEMFQSNSQRILSRNAEIISNDLLESESPYNITKQCESEIFYINGAGVIQTTEDEDEQLQLQAISPCVGDVEKLKSDCLAMDGRIKNLEQKSDNMNNVLERIYVEYVKISSQLDKIYSILKYGNNTVGSSDKNGSAETPGTEEELETKFSLPVSTIEELLNFDKEIQTNSKYNTYLIKQFSEIGGVDGNGKGLKIGFKLVEMIFTANVLTFTSWTGISRSSEKKKIPFQKFDGILDVFFKVLQMADSRWNKHENVSLFKDKILKHSNQRAIASNEKLYKRLKIKDNIHEDSEDEFHQVNENTIDENENINPNEETAKMLCSLSPAKNLQTN